MSDQKSFHRLGPASDIEPGHAKDYKVAGHGVVVANCDGEFFAIEDRCTHDDGPLGEGKLLGCDIECPRHGARFDVRDGRVLCMPAIVPINTYEVRVVDGDIQVAIPEE